MKKVLILLLIGIAAVSCQKETEKTAQGDKIDTLKESETPEYRMQEADSVAVKEIVKVIGNSDEQYSHPKFSHDDSRILFTTGNYKGIWIVNKDGSGLKQLTDARGSGYNFAVAESRPVIYYRQDEFGKRGRRLSYSIVKYNYDTDENSVIYQSEEEISYPIAFKDGLAFIKNENPYYIKDGNNAKPLKDSEFFYAYSKVNKIIIIEGENKKVINPVGSSNIIWTEVMPYHKQIMFTAAGDGTYLFDPKDSSKTKLGEFEQPQASGKYPLIVFAKTSDDGMKTTGSDIYVYNRKGSSRKNLTKNTDEIELNPVWSNSGKEIAFNNLNGEIKIIKLTIVN
jgi:Tol biopolymer transport system component